MERSLKQLHKELSYGETFIQLLFIEHSLYIVLIFGKVQKKLSVYVLVLRTMLHILQKTTYYDLFHRETVARIFADIFS